jgi:chromosome segregation ATPase
MYSFIQTPSVNYDGRILPMPFMFNLKEKNGKNTKVTTNEISDTLKKYIDDKFNELKKNLVVPVGGINPDELERFGSQLKQEIKGDIMTNVESLVEKANDTYFQKEDFKQHIVALNAQLTQMYEGKFDDLIKQINVLTTQNKDLVEDVDTLKRQQSELNSRLNSGLNLTDTPNMDDYITKEQYTKNNEFLEKELNARTEDSLRIRGDVNNILTTELPRVYDAVNDNAEEIEQLQEDVEELTVDLNQLQIDLRDVQAKVYDASNAISPEEYNQHVEELERLTERVNSLNRDHVTRDEINGIKSNLSKLRTNVNNKVAEIYKNVNAMLTKKLETITTVIDGISGEVPVDLSQKLTDLIQQIDSINQQVADSVISQAEDTNMKQEIKFRLEMIEQQLKQFDEELELNNQEIAEIKNGIKRNTELITSNMDKREQLYQELLKRVAALESKPEQSTIELERLSGDVARMKESGNRNIQTLVKDIQALKQNIARLQQTTGNQPIPTESGNVDLTQVQTNIDGINARLNVLSQKLNTMATNTDLQTLRIQVEELVQDEENIKNNYNMLVSTLKIIKNTKSIPAFVDGVSRLQNLNTKYLQHAGSVCGAFNC